MKRNFVFNMIKPNGVVTKEGEPNEPINKGKAVILPKSPFNNYFKEIINGIGNTMKRGIK